MAVMAATLFPVSFGTVKARSTERPTGVATQVAYPNVKQVKGNNLSEGAKIAIGVAIILGLGVLLAIVIGRDG